MLLVYAGSMVWAQLIYIPLTHKKYVFLKKFKINIHVDFVFLIFKCVLRTFFLLVLHFLESICFVCPSHYPIHVAD